VRARLRKVRIPEITDGSAWQIEFDFQVASVVPELVTL